MPDSWDERRRLLRLAGAVDEIVASARAAPESVGGEAGRQITALLDDIGTLLAVTDGEVAGEFRRVVGSAPSAAESRSAAVSAAAALGWLKAYLAGTTADERRRGEAQARPAAGGEGAPGARARRRQTIGFRVRSPITREVQAEDRAEPTGD